MKRLVLTLALLPLGALAEDISPTQQIDNALMMAIEAKQIANCGLRDQAWADGIFAMAMLQTAAAAPLAIPPHASAHDGTKPWSNLAKAMSLDFPLVKSECANYAANAPGLAEMDSLSAMGHIGD